MRQRTSTSVTDYEWEPARRRPSEPAPRPQPRRRRPGRRRARRLVRLLLLLGLLAGFVWLGLRTAPAPPAEPPAAPPAEPEAEPAAPPVATADGPAAGVFRVNPVNLLIVGTDADPSAGRTDTMIVLSADLAAGRLVAVSIPRDTRLELSGYGTQKINAAYPLGGTPLAAKAAANAVGEPIHHFVRVDLAGFQGLVDALGGVELEVDKRMRYTDRSQGLRIDLQPGLQRLDGAQAMQYVRFRKDAEADLGRIRRQQTFLRAVARELCRPRNLTRLPTLIELLSGQVETTLSPQQMLALARLTARVDAGSLTAVQLPGEARMIDGLSYFLLSPEAPMTLRQARRATAPGIAPAPALVTIYNGADRLGLERLVAERLTAAGYRAVPADQPMIASTDRSRLYNQNPAQRASATPVETLLRVPLSSNPAPTNLTPAASLANLTGAPVILVLGADYAE